MNDFKKVREEARKKHQHDHLISQGLSGANTVSIYKSISIYKSLYFNHAIQGYSIFEFVFNF